MMFLTCGSLARWWVSVFTVALCTQVAARGDIWKPAQNNAAWRSECSTCHMAFPPGLLPSEDWMEIMAHLEQHFGVDASLEPQVKADISAYLKQNGASNTLFDRHDDVPRITTTVRFEDHHRSAIRLWSKGLVKSLSDCGACHKLGDTLP